MPKRLLTFFLKKMARLDSPGRIAHFAARRYAKRPFIIQPDGDIAFTFEEFVDKARETASALWRLGLARGDVLAFREGNSADYFVYRLACHNLGVGFMALPASLEEETAFALVTKVGARAFYSGGRPVSLPLNRTRSWPYASTFNVSSGTTGDSPKIVGLTNGNWVESLYSYVKSSKESPGAPTVFLCTLSLATAGSTTFLPSLLGGITCVVVQENPEPALLAEYVKRYQVNQLYLTPHRLFAFAEWCTHHSLRFETLKKIITGTERAPATLLGEAIKVFGPIVHVGYGMVEALPPLTMLSPENYHKMGSVGKPLPGVNVRIGADGRIAIRTKTVGIGYLEDPEQTKAHFRDGWFYTNDFGRIDDEGFLYVMGRGEEILAENPRRVFAAECEDALYRVPAVRRCAAISKNGRVVAFVSMRGKADPSELAATAHAVIDCEIIVMDDIPINGLGKIDRRSLAEQIS